MPTLKQLTSVGDSIVLAHMRSKLSQSEIDHVPSRWKLRQAIKVVNEALNDLRVVKHPDKTFIGRIARGFDFLGYWFSAAGLSIARKTVERMVEKALRLYEQDAMVSCIEACLVRWRRWVKSGGRVGAVALGRLGCAVGCVYGL